jgi:hypothetical protein
MPVVVSVTATAASFGVCHIDAERLRLQGFARPWLVASSAKAVNITQIQSFWPVLVAWHFTWPCSFCFCLQDDLWGNAVLLKEANAISVELKKKVGRRNVALFYGRKYIRVLWLCGGNRRQ